MVDFLKSIDLTKATRLEDDERYWKTFAGAGERVKKETTGIREQLRKVRGLSAAELSSLAKGSSSDTLYAVSLELEKRPSHAIEANKFLRASAEAKNSFGACALATKYLTGTGGFPKKSKEAIEWFTKATEWGNPLGIHRLGLIYEQGTTGKDSVKPDKKKALKFYKQAAELGYAESAFSLANHYQSDKEEKDEKEAAKWFQAASENGYAPAQYTVGRQLYAKGEHQEAIKFLAQAANQEHGQAQYILGLLLQQKSAYQNLDSAETWLRKATRNGQQQAQTLLQKVIEEKKARYMATLRELSAQSANGSEDHKHGPGCAHGHGHGGGSHGHSHSHGGPEHTHDDEEEEEETSSPPATKAPESSPSSSSSSTTTTSSSTTEAKEIPKEDEKKKKPVKAEGRECSMCGNVLPKSSYVARQWKAKSHSRRCKQCSIDMIE